MRDLSTALCDYFKRSQEGCVFALIPSCENEVLTLLCNPRYFELTNVSKSPKFLLTKLMELGGDGLLHDQVQNNTAGPCPLWGLTGAMTSVAVWGLVKPLFQDPAFAPAYIHVQEYDVVPAQEGSSPLKVVAAVGAPHQVWPLHRRPRKKATPPTCPVTGAPMPVKKRGKGTSAKKTGGVKKTDPQCSAPRPKRKVAQDVTMETAENEAEDDGREGTAEEDPSTDISDAAGSDGGGASGDDDEDTSWESEDETEVPRMVAVEPSTSEEDGDGDGSAGALK